MSRTKFLIDEAYHKRWNLDREGHYWYNSVMYGNDLRMSVIQVSTGHTVESRLVKLDDPDWERKSQIFQSEMKSAYGD
jgi:hypothetical protein